MSFYADMQGVATELLGEFKQGEIAYLEPQSGGGDPDPWNPQPGEPRRHPVSAAKASGERLKKYIAGGYITTTDALLVVEAFGVDPKMSGLMEINGVKSQIVMVDPATLDPQNPVAWFIGCRR